MRTYENHIYPPEKVKKKGEPKQAEKALLVTQKIFGVCLLLISVLLVLIASTGTTVEDRDASAVLLTTPLGLYMLLTKDLVITP